MEVINGIVELGWIKWALRKKQKIKDILLLQETVLIVKLLVYYIIH